MSLPRNLTERELSKFVLDANGNIAVNTVISGADIQIGAVEVKDGATDIRQSIASTATGNPAMMALMDRTGNVATVNASGQLLSTAVFTGNITLNPSPNFIGLVSLAQPIAVTDNSGSLTVDWLSGATVNLSNATLYAVVNTEAAGQASVVLDSGIKWIGLATVNLANQLQTGTNYVGLASVNIGGTLPALSTGTNYIGLASVNVGNVVPVSDNSDSLTVDWLSGATVTPASQPALVASNAYIGLASVNIGGTLPSLSAGAAYIGLASVNIGGALPALVASTAYIGLASVNIGGINTYGGKTPNVIPIALNASGMATLAVPTNKFYVTNINLSANATTRLAILSGTTYVLGNASIGAYISPQGGFIENGTPDSPVLIGLANAAALVFEVQSWLGPIGGKIIWYDE